MPETREHIRALADLFLTGAPGHEPDHSSAPRAHTCIEMILVGHLPVRAGLWLTQYADDVAREKGPTALLRFDTDQVILEILRGTGSSVRAAAAVHLEEAIAACGPDLAHWIIRPGIDDRLGAMIESSPDLFTILTGAGDAAVVAAYRTIKDLRDAAARMDRALPAVELSILGADSGAAERAAASIAETSELHLGIRPALRRTVRAMGSLGSTLHFRFPSDNLMPLPALVSHLRAAGGAPSLPHFDQTREAEAWAAAPAKDLSMPEPPPPEDAMYHQRMQMLATPIGEVGFRAPSVAPAEAGSPSAGVAEDAAPEPIRLSPKIEVHVEPKHIAPRPTPRAAPPAKALATWIQGLALLPLRCPDAPEVEIAVDSMGGCHVIAWEDRLRALGMVSAWLRKHRELVALACHEYVIDSSRPIQSHVVTSEPRQIADLHGTELRLHLLAPVEVDGKSGWYSAALNG